MSDVLCRSREITDRLMRVFRTELPALLVPLILTALWTLNREDIAFDDEASYLAKGLGQSPINSFSDGALYGFLYRLVAIFSSDPTTTYLLGRAVVACTFVFGIWLAIRLIGRPGPAWSVASIMALTPVPHVWPGATVPAAAIMLVCFSLLWRFTGLWVMTVASVGTWIAASMRPEFIWMATAISIWAMYLIVISFRRPGRRLSHLLALAITISAPLVLFRTLGWPWAPTDRSWAAFSQHFSLRAARPDENPWYESPVITRRFFGESDSVVSALLVNPSRLLAHVLNNVRDTLPEVVAFAWGWRPQLLSLETVAQIGLVLLVICSLIGLVVALHLRRNNQFIEGSPPPLSGRSLFYVVLWIGTIAISVSVIFPRQHYLVSLVGLLSLGTGALLSLKSVSVINRLLMTLTVILVIGASVLTLAELANRLIATKPYAFAAQELSELAPLTLLSGQAGFDSYVPNLNVVDAGLPLEDATFEEFLETQRIGAVILTDALRFGPWAELPGYEQFESDPATFGYSRLSPNSYIWLSPEFAEQRRDS